MGTAVSSALFFFFFSASVVRHALGQSLGGLATQAIQAAAQAAQTQLLQQQNAVAQDVQLPSPAEMQRIEAIQQAKHNQVSASETQNAVKKLLNEYKELEQDLAAPLTDKTATLKAERLNLMRRVSTLTNEVRAAFDSLHPDKVKMPLIIVAKTPDDDMRAAANRIDALGSLDELRGIVSPCATFHAEREAQKKELEVAQRMNNFDEEARALSRMTPEERLNYDRTMAEEYKAKKKQLQKAMRKAGIPGRI